MEELFQLVKDKLKITWDDDDTNREIEVLIEDAEIILNSKLGAKIDYLEPGQERRLFLNYCLYAYNDMEADFDNVYFNEIMQLRIKWEVLDEETDEE